MTQEQPYDVVAQFDTFELRRYPEHVLAQVEVDGTFDRAGSAAFSTLFGYITGDNASKASIAMTAPVVQRSTRRESIAMTAPVTHTESGPGQFVVAFILPAMMTEDTAPLPTNPAVRVLVVPESFVAAMTFSGRASEASYAKHRGALSSAIDVAGLTVSGPPRLAQFDAPRTPGFRRHNEVQQPVLPPDQRRRSL